MSDIPVGLTQVADKVDARLEQLFADERAQWVQVDPRLVEAIDELARMTAGGKRLRAGFCYWAWAGVHDGEIDEQPIIDAGAAFELLQVFALIHDDVMDAADTRRNRPTIHVEQAKRLTSNQWRGEPRRYGEGVAILVGDLGHVYADRFVGGAHPTARNVWDQLRIELNLGQYLDMQAAASGEVSRETAQRVAMFKSALYTIVRPLQLGAALHGRVPCVARSTRCVRAPDRPGLPAARRSARGLRRCRPGRQARRRRPARRQADRTGGGCRRTSIRFPAQGPGHDRQARPV
ncbi:MAG: polyprenyl synthetase family protein [Acidimicrobiales bacterium]